MFFDVSWDAIHRGKVYIRLLGDAGRTLQFLYLCTGEKGPSYASTRFLEVIRKGEQGEQIWGGDYENDDGSGGAALPGMTRGDENYRNVRAGLVGGFYYPGYGCDHNPAQFGVYTRDMVGFSEMSSIGEILSGLEWMLSVRDLDDVCSACVSDCGLVLFH